MAKNIPAYELSTKLGKQSRQGFYAFGTNLRKVCKFSVIYILQEFKIYINDFFISIS